MMNLEQHATNIRKNIVTEVYSAKSGHPGGSLSAADILTELYFEQMDINEENVNTIDRDRFVLSKGHASPVLYTTLKEKGLLEEDLTTFRHIDSKLHGHPNMNYVAGVDMSTGSLGQGISCAVGMALASKMSNDNATIYCIIGDGESQEGQIWEASMYASQKKLNNFILFLDNNGMQIDNYTDQINSLINPAKKWESFGFYAQTINGNDISEIDEAIDNAKKQKDKPSIIVLNTVKGKGVSFIEKLGVANHSTTISKEQLEEALEELK